MFGLIIGSRALEYHGIDIGRSPRDYDYIMPWANFEDFRDWKNWTSCIPTSDSKWVLRLEDEIHEIEIAWEGTSAALLIDYVRERTNNFSEFIQVTPDVVLMLKLSHRFLKNSPHFLKTMRDIQILRGLDFKVDGDLQYILHLRELETYWYEHPDLNRSKEEFFVDEYLFDHDSLHEVVALDIVPAYTKFQTSGAEVNCDMDLFLELPLHIQLEAVYEESAVLALERSFIPHGKDEQWAFEMALGKVCTSITSGRFRSFAWEHYDKVLEMKQNVKVPYTTAFFNGIISGVVKPQEL